MNRPGDSAEQHGWAPELSQLPGLRPHSEAGGHAAPGPAAVGGALPDLYTLRCIYFKHYLFFSSQCLYSLLALKLPTSQPRCCVCVCVCTRTHVRAHTHSCSVNYMMITTYPLKSHSCLRESFLGAKCSNGNICSRAPSPEPTYEVSPCYSALTNTSKGPACPCFFNSNIH